MVKHEPSSTHLRAEKLGRIKGLENRFSAEFSCDLFRLMCISRAFELCVKKEVDQGNVNCLVYLSLGQESISAGISSGLSGVKPWVLGQHRAHATYLSFGGAWEPLVDELLGLPSGCCGGMAGSPPIQDFENRIIGHVGLIGDQVPVSAGVALTNPDDQVVCFFGDGAAEEDYVLAALGFAASRNLNILFVCEDNDLSVLTPTATRRNWRVADVAGSFGLDNVEIADDPWLIAHWAKRLKGRPALMNVQTCRDIWHAGIGNDGPPKWDRFQITKNTMADIGLGVEAQKIEEQASAEIGKLWAKQLQTLFES
jgi:pyruvate dehydrogenase E1 component alpha subunit